MAGVCRIVPKVRNKQGKMVDSQLHQDLGLFVSDMDMRNQTWSVAHSDEFREAHPDMATDNNGEVTVEELVGKTDVGTLVSDEQVVTGMNEMNSFRHAEKDVQGIRQMTRQAVELNEKSPLNSRVTAVVSNEEDASRVRFEPKTEETVERAEDMKKGQKLYERLTEWLANQGIGVEALNEAEESAGIDGVTDFTSTKRTASGLAAIIRIAQNKAGEAALTEEAAHLAIAAAMGKDRNVDRALNLLRSNEELVKEVLGEEYEKYFERYKGNKEKLAHEAAGHLLRDALTTEFQLEQKKLAGKYKSLWRRMVDAVVDFFKRCKATDLERMLHEAQLSSKKTARDILDDSFYITPDFSDEIKALGKMFALSEEQKTKLDDMTMRLMRDMSGRMKRIPGWVRRSAWKRSGGKNEGFYTTLKETRDEMKELSDKQKSLLAIERYLGHTMEEFSYQLESFQRRFDKASKDESRAYIINNIDELCKVNERVAKDISEMLDELEANVSTNEEKASLARIKSYLFGAIDKENNKVSAGIFSLISQCRSKIKQHKMKVFVDYVSHFIPIDKIIVPRGGKAYGRKEGEEIKLSDQMEMSPEVGSWDKWTLAASLSNSFPIQSFQRMLNIFKLKIRQEWKEYEKMLRDLTLNLEQAGYTNQDFMFERDKDGKLTGFYIKNDSAEYKALSQAQKDYYDAVIAIKKELDSMLPSNMRRLLSAVKIRKDMIEHLETDKTISQTIKEKLHDAVNIASDDEYVLSNDPTMIDYDGNEIRVVPIRFLKFAPGEDSQNLSTDIAGTLTRYAQMCCNYSMMSRIMPVMELGRTLMEEGKSQKTKKAKDEEGNVTETDISKTRGENNGDNTLDRLNDILESELYGFKMEHVTTEIGGKQISITAIGQKLLALTAMSQYMLSPAAAIQNGLTAQIQAALATSQKKYFNGSDLAFGHQIFTQQMPNIFNDVFNRNPTSKISLFCELMNVMQKDEFGAFNHKGLKRFSGSDLYCLTTSTEYHANMVIALALAHRTQLKTKDGSDINFWDALEVVDYATKRQRDADAMRAKGFTVEADAMEEAIKKHPEWKNSHSKYLVLQKGVTKADGSEFSFQSNSETTDLEKLIRKSMHTSHMLNGIYNSEDAAKWQRYIGGSMLGMYRKWIAPMWYRRINGLNYSLDEEEWNEGYYRTLGRIGFVRAKALFDKTLAQKIKGEKLADWEKANLRNAITEVGSFVVLCALAWLLKMGKKKNRSFAYNQLYYFTVRTKSELGSMTPTAAPTEALRIMQSPSAVLPTVNNIFGLASALVNPFDWGITEDGYVKSGKYKGYTKLERAIMKAPLLPGVKQWVSFVHPEDAVKFYE